MGQPVLLADIDNTLYDWPAFFAPSFRAMIHALSRETAVSEDELYDQCKTVFSHHESLEYAFLIQELECVQSADNERVRRLVEVGRGAFKSVQKRKLQPYPGVVATLQWLREQDVLVIGVTNSPVYRVQHRLFNLKIDALLSGLVGWEGFDPSGEDPANAGFVRRGRQRSRSRLRKILSLPHVDCKPNEKAYTLALDAFGATPSDAWAIGDSLAKDLEPAARLGIRTIWARYGATFDPEDKNMATLLRITHWDSSRVHSTYKKNDFAPDFVLSDFGELMQVIPSKLLTLF